MVGDIRLDTSAGIRKILNKVPLWEIVRKFGLTFIIGWQENYAVDCYNFMKMTLIKSK
ncbi:MAG: hypothetical protein ACTSYB_10735 [Candidatus Helarchaeota archaeon]